MAKHINLTVSESIKELKSSLAKQPTILKRSRVKALLLIKEGKVVYTRDISKKLKYDRRTVYNWLKTYESQGLVGLIKVTSGGNNTPVLSSEIKHGIKEKLSQPDTNITSYVELLDWVRSTYGEEVKYKTLYTHCRNHLKSRLKVARKSHYKKDPQAIEAFKKTTQYAR